MASNIATAQVNVGGSSVLLAASRAGRVEIRINPFSSQFEMYVGMSTVTPLNGFRVHQDSATGSDAFGLFNFDGALYGVCLTQGGAVVPVAVMEIY